MNFSQRTSSGYDTSFPDDGPTPSRRQQISIGHGSRKLYCFECGCYLEAISQEISDLRKENKRLRHQIIEEKDLSEREQYWRTDLQQMLHKTEEEHEAALHHLRSELHDIQKKLHHTQLWVDNFSAENEYLQHKLHVTQKDNDTLQDNVIKKQWKVECFIGITGQLQEEATQLKQQLSDSENQRERTQRAMLNYKSLVSDITDEAEQLHETAQQLQISHDKLSETTFNAFCKVRPTLLDLHKVILRNIPNNSENSKRWLEFLTALDMRHEDIPCLTLSDSDARWNVYSVLDAWLNGSGSQPKTWGTLLRALHERGTPFLVKLACAAKEVYLRKLASLPLPFDVCCVCWKDCSLTTATECSE